jgi:ubiquinone biosynthesis protein
MVDPALTPTRFARPEMRARIPLRRVEPRPRFYTVRMLWRFAVWVSMVGWRRLVGRLTPEQNARNLVQLLDRLGGLWIMVGQMLSMRVDLFSAALCRELSAMQTRGSAVPFDAARAVIEEDLGRPLEDVFDQFASAPFAATWVSQVHRARLRREGVWTAVKVLHPDIGDRFKRDLALIARLARWIERVGFNRTIQWQVGTWELRQIVEQETDFRFEAAAIGRMRVNLPNKRVEVPQVFEDYCTSRVLVTEFIHATLVSDLVYAKQHEPARLQAWLEENDIDPQSVARRLFHSFLRQMFEDNFYHGDLYAGNIVLLRSNRLALLHFGSCGFTDREYLEKVRLFFRALATRDYTKAADIALLLCTTLPQIDVDRLKEDLIRVLRAWTARTYVTDLPYDQKSIDNATVEVMRTLYQHRCTMDWGFLRIRRAIAVLDTSLVHLYSDVNYTEMCEDYFRRAERRRILQVRPRALATRLASTALRSLDVQDRVAEFTMFYGPIIRRRAQVFEVATDRFSYLAGTLFGHLAIAVGLLGVLLAAALLERARPGTVAPILGAQFTAAVTRLPSAGPAAWTLVLGVAYTTFGLWRLRRRFLAEQPHVSGPTLGL